MGGKTGFTYCFKWTEQYDDDYLNRLEDQLLHYAAAHKVTVIRLFRDNATTSREKLRDLMKAIESDKPQYLFMPSVDHIGSGELWNHLLVLLEGKSIELHTLNGKYVQKKESAAPQTGKAVD